MLVDTCEFDSTLDLIKRADNSIQLRLTILFDMPLNVRLALGLALRDAIENNKLRPIELANLIGNYLNDSDPEETEEFIKNLMSLYDG